jgi:hypothetical protein
MGLMCGYGYMGNYDEVEVEVGGEVRNIIHYLHFWYH